MSLPKRDGVHGRYYLIQKSDTDPEVLEHADQCIQDVLDGTAKENHSGYPLVVRNQSGTPLLPSQLLERYLSKLPLKGFPCEDAVVFCDALRRLVGWQEIRYELEKYIEKQVQERFFLVGERDDGFTVFPPCTVWPELRAEDVDEGLLRFACYRVIEGEYVLVDLKSAQKVVIPNAGWHPFFSPDDQCFSVGGRFYLTQTGEEIANPFPFSVRQGLNFSDTCMVRTRGSLMAVQQDRGSSPIELWDTGSGQLLASIDDPFVVRQVNFAFTQSGLVLHTDYGAMSIYSCAL